MSVQKPVLSQLQPSISAGSRMDGPQVAYAYQVLLQAQASGQGKGALSALHTAVHHS